MLDTPGQMLASTEMIAARIAAMGGLNGLWGGGGGGGGGGGEASATPDVAEGAMASKLPRAGDLVRGNSSNKQGSGGSLKQMCVPGLPVKRKMYQKKRRGGSSNVAGDGGTPSAPTPAHEGGNEGSSAAVDATGTAAVVQLSVPVQLLHRQVQA